MVVMVTNSCYGYYSLSVLFICSYLEKEKVNAGGSTTWIYKWGPRAHLEVDKKELLLVMCEVCVYVPSQLVHKAGQYPVSYLI